MASIGGGYSSKKQKQQSHSVSKLSPEALAIQQLLMRYAMNWMGQGRQDYGSFLAAGGKSPAYPQMPMTQGEASAFGSVNQPLTVYDFLNAITIPQNQQVAKPSGGPNSMQRMPIHMGSMGMF